MTITDQTEITINELCKRYNTQPVLDRLALSVAGNELCVLVGANGAGKSTLLRILAALIRPDSGEINLNGKSLYEAPSLRQKIGYLGHQTLFYGDLSARENLLHYARLYQLSYPDEIIRERINESGLAFHQDKPIRTYSRGMQQRLAIERALLHDPSILLLDEPYSGLDQEAAESLDERLRRLHEQGRTLLIAAHRPQRLLTFTTQIAWLREGKIAKKVPVSQLSEAPDLSRYIREIK